MQDTDVNTNVEAMASKGVDIKEAFTHEITVVNSNGPQQVSLCKYLQEPNDFERLIRLGLDFKDALSVSLSSV